MSESTVHGLHWLPLRGVDQLRLSEARLQAHYAIQWLARAARAYVAPQPDDSHTNLGWDSALGSFTTHAFKDGLWLSLRITDLTLSLHGGGTSSSVQSFPLDGCRDTQARQWLSGQFDARGLDAHAIAAPSPYEMPAHAVARGAPYSLTGLTDALVELAAWFNNAELSLGSIQRQMIGRNWAASPVRCWPHHFDLATLTTLPARNHGTDRIYRCRTVSRRRVLRRALFLCIGLSRTRSCSASDSADARSLAWPRFHCGRGDGS